MITSEDIKDRIKNLEFLQSSLTKDLKEFVVNKEIPLDERWELFFKANLGEESSSIEDFVNLDSDDVASVRDMNRHEIFYLGDVREYGMESIRNQEDYDEFREDVLRKFIKSYEWDW